MLRVFQENLQKDVVRITDRRARADLEFLGSLCEGMLGREDEEGLGQLAGSPTSRRSSIECCPTMTRSIARITSCTNRLCWRPKHQSP